MKEEQIIESEKQLLEAMKKNDLESLNDLLYDDLLFTIPNGQVLTKAMDLENFRSGNISINTISSSEQVIHLVGDNAIVSTLITLNGKYFSQPVDGKFRYIRVWKLFDDKWKVIAGSGIQV
jgi:ketosteroid isomerase-like protein